MGTKHKTHKTPVARKPAEVTAYKERFIKQLAMGRAPGLAAEKINISKVTAYGWRNNDEQFAKDWDDAIDTGVDKIESALHKRGIEHSDTAALAILRAYRPERWVRKDITDTHTSVTLQVSLQEHTKRLERFGLVTPLLIESDAEEVDAPASLADVAASKSE